MKDMTIFSTNTIKEVMKKLDISANKVLFVVNDQKKLLGSVSDGDIRRHILNSGDLSTTISGVYNRNPIFFTEDSYNESELKDALIKNKIEVVPIVNRDYIIVDYKVWSDVFGNKETNLSSSNRLKDIPVVIMAGGKGTRLKPFTDVLPKPLVPIKEKPIMDWIIDEFKVFGANRFYATLNYRGKMIEAYYSSINKDFTIEYAWEDDFYGTAGSLNLLKGEIDGTFIVSNCDIIVKANYEDVLNFHKKSGAMMTIVSSIQHHQIPYGVIEFSDGGKVKNIMEKPEYSHAINTGVYILEKECLNFIPEKQFFHITHLMEILMEKGLNVMTYPVNENDYIDIGQWEEYMSASEKFNF